MAAIRRFLGRWIIMTLIIGSYFIFHDVIGWDQSMNWSRFIDFISLGTLGIFLLSIYGRKKKEL